MAHGKQGAIAYYIVIALILGAITYVEFAIIHYHESFTWLSPLWKIIILTSLSLIKFGLVVAIYMHLRDDDPMYTGFFSSGMIIAMGTFIALSFLFTVRSVNALRATAPEVTAAHGEASHGEAQSEAIAALLSGERVFSETLRSPTPKNQSLKVSLPAAPAPSFSLPVLGMGVSQAPQPAQETEPAASVETPKSTVVEEAAVEPASEAVTKIETETPEEPLTETATTAEAAIEETNSEAADSNVVETTAAETTVAEASAEAASEETPSEVQATEDANLAEARAEEAASEEGDAAILAQAADFDWQELGDKTYSTNCIACHQATGQGIPSAFPPLAGHMPELYNTEGGRNYLIHVVLYGLQGEVAVAGSTYNGVMPPWSQLSDEQIAATLNHELMSWGNDALVSDFSPILPEEVAAVRGASLTAAQVLELRPSLP